MSEPRKIYLAVLDTDELAELSYRELKHEFSSMRGLPPPAENQTYVTGKNEDDELIVFVFNIPSNTKKKFNFLQRMVIRKYCRSNIRIMAKLHRSLMALMVYEHIDEALLVIPDQMEEYRNLFRVVILNIFDVVEERYDPESGERVY